MKEIEYELVDNVLKAEDFVRLRVEAGFMKKPLEQAEKALKNGLFNVLTETSGPGMEKWIDIDR